MDYKYAYLIGVLSILFPIWLFLLIRRKDLRKEILLTSIVIGLLGPFSELLYLRDYWHPETIGTYPFGPEGFLFGFLLSGIAVSIYEEVYGRHLYRVKKLQRPLFVLFFVIGFLLIVLPLVFLAGLNSIYATTIGLLAIATTVVFLRRDLVAHSLIGGLLTGVIMFLSYVVFLFIFPEAVGRWWSLQNVSSILILGIPIEELIWAFAVGATIGPIYEFLLGYRLR
ncbi:MAG: hypothetical protein G01um10142_102 [Parcubacteria group bacterium Gr01-1014_2]|nr:MAG: hypothetical protein G01um10142_102 [Parcubacteria group bacterium Gr01-1014_2]